MENFHCDICGKEIPDNHVLGKIGAAAIHAQAHKTAVMGKVLQYLEERAKTDPEANAIYSEISAYNELTEKILKSM